MLKHTQLIDYNENLERGFILRCKGKYPYEAYVDFMIVESYVHERRPYALLVVSGYKAGATFVVLPEESLPEGNEGYAVDVNWLKLNWKYVGVL